MLRVAFKYRFVKLLRTKEVIFWMLIFPIILITTFNTIISNIDMGETMETASLGIVKTAEMKNDQTPLEKIGEKNGKNLKLIKLNEKKAKKCCKEENFKRIYCRNRKRRQADIIILW